MRCGLHSADDPPAREPKEQREDVVAHETRRGRGGQVVNVEAPIMKELD